MSPLTLRTPSSSCVIDPTRGGTITSLVFDGVGDVLWIPSEGLSPFGFPGGGIPFCFPWAGRTWVDGQVHRWRLGESVFEMPIHGFFGDVSCDVSKSGDSSVSCRAEFPPRHHAGFPFAFSVEHRYRLTGDSLEWKIKVRRDPRCMTRHMMPVALGWHPYFRLDAVGSDAVFAAEARLAIEVAPTGTAGQARPMDFSAPVSACDNALRSLILGDLREGRFGMYSPSSKKFIDVTFGPAGLLNQVVLWSKTDQGFFCAEPWMGLPDAVHSGAGVRWLNPGETLIAQVTFAAGVHSADASNR